MITCVLKQKIVILMFDLQRQVDSMDTAALRSIVVHILERQPGMLFDLLATAAPGGQQPGPAPPAALPDWCTCDQCMDMPTDMERKCCQCQPQNCISLRPVSDFLEWDRLEQMPFYK